MHAKPQIRVYMMHDLGALRRARPTAIAVPLVSTCSIVYVVACRSSENQRGDVTLYAERPRSRTAQVVHQRA